MDIIALGASGAAGIFRILDKKYDELCEGFDRQYLDSAQKAHEQQKRSCAEFLKIHPSMDNAEIYQVGEGGILACLYLIAKNRDCGMRIEIRAIPLLQSGIEICEFYRLNIYRLQSESFILLCESGCQMVQMLRREGYLCEVIGYLTEDRDKCIVDKDEEEHLNRPAEDEIYKVIGRE